jgi:hypothetical protein
MALTWPVIAAVLFGALLHASWNALVKSSTDKALDMPLIHLIGSLLAIPLVAGWAGRQSLAVYCGLGHHPHWLLHRADRRLPARRPRADLPAHARRGAAAGGFVEPRSPWANRLSALAWAGRGGHQRGRAGAGLEQLEQAKRRSTQSHRAFALANAVIIAIYTVVDALGVRAAGNAMQYVVRRCSCWTAGRSPVLMFAKHGRTSAAYARRAGPIAAIGARCFPGLLRHCACGP